MTIDNTIESARKAAVFIPAGILLTFSIIWFSIGFATFKTTANWVKETAQIEYFGKGDSRQTYVGYISETLKTEQHDIPINSWNSEWVVGTRIPIIVNPNNYREVEWDNGVGLNISTTGLTIGIITFAIAGILVTEYIKKQI